jgi:uncharacterized iron-regulated protein
MRSDIIAVGRQLFAVFVVVASCSGCALTAREHVAISAVECLAPATWYSTARQSLERTSEAQVLRKAARGAVVLVGEQHDQADHHLWQLQVVAALHVMRPDMVIGFEAFPRRTQPILDQWTSGQLTQQQFLDAVDWEKIWGLPAPLYASLFEFARINRVPMAALNVDRALTSDISRNGWEAIPQERREGVSRAAPALRAYDDYLWEIYKRHAKPADKREISRDDPAFNRFVEAQTTWDRAMAEAIAVRVASAGTSNPLVVGIMGSGHVQYGYGVAHQLRDLGINNVATLLPMDSDTLCSEIEPNMADAVFAIPADLRDKPSSKSP